MCLGKYSMHKTLESGGFYHHHNTGFGVPPSLSFSLAPPLPVVYVCAALCTTLERSKKAHDLPALALSNSRRSFKTSSWLISFHGQIQARICPSTHQPTGRSIDHLNNLLPPALPIPNLGTASPLTPKFPKLYPPNPTPPPSPLALYLRTASLR